MSALKVCILTTLVKVLAVAALSPMPAPSSLDWDLELNETLPLVWDRSRWVLSVTKEGKFVLDDRSTEAEALLESRAFDAVREVEFLFYSRDNGLNPVKFYFDRIDRLPSYGFRKDRPTKILIHGWMGGSESGVIGPLAMEYLKKGDVNVIGVNWTKGSGNLIYRIARNRVPMVADLVVETIEKLLEFGQTPDQIGMIGHSLGAHIAGLAGKRIRPKVAYIVGLDPAKPRFQLSQPQDRLTDADAENVEVVHTRGRFLGFFENIGTADFYPNGGKSQPGCKILDIPGICDHIRAVAYFKESLMAKGYFADRCADLKNLNSRCSLGRVEFGEVHVHPLMSKPRGVYYFETASEAPFLKTSPKDRIDERTASDSLIIPVHSQGSFDIETRVDVGNLLRRLNALQG